MGIARFIEAEFIEGKVLPVVVAFGLGVLATTHAARAELDVWEDSYRTLVHEVDGLRITCGLQPDPEAVPQQTALRQVTP